MTDSTDGAWKSPAKGPRLCGATKNLRVTGRNMGGKRERDGERGDKRVGEERRGRVGGREEGRRRWCLFEEGTVLQSKECACLRELGVCECLKFKKKTKQKN